MARFLTDLLEVPENQTQSNPALWPITKDEDNSVNKSKLKILCSWREARENAC